jgi:methionyl-tRNA formyltransferase
MVKGVKLDIYDSVRADGSGAPGTVLAIAGDGMLVAGNGGAILIKRVKAPDGKKIAAAEWAGAAGIAVGDRFDPPAPKASA